MTQRTSGKAGALLIFASLAVAVVGYFVGLQSPMPGRTLVSNELVAKSTPFEAAEKIHDLTQAAQPATGMAIPATHYSEMGAATRIRGASTRSNLSQLVPVAPSLEEFQISNEEKLFALQLRSLNRAFNGAPPTIPHPIDQMNADACMACHGEGIRTESMRVSRMSHEFLANCTQCHVDSSPRAKPVQDFVESTFVGIPAPTGGPRAFEGAPPQIPHTTWMRIDCMSCHGFAGVQGIRTTHPWRNNCQQCHAPSSKLDQVELVDEPRFLAPPVISSKNAVKDDD